MRIDFTGRQIDIGPDLRQYTEERLRKLARLLGDRAEMHVILTAEKHRRMAEITLKFGDHTLVGVEETGDFRTSINRAWTSWSVRRYVFLRSAARASVVPIRPPRCC